MSLLAVQHGSVAVDLNLEGRLPNRVGAVNHDVFVPVARRGERVHTVHNDACNFAVGVIQFGCRELEFFGVGPKHHSAVPMDRPPLLSVIEDAVGAYSCVFGRNRKGNQ